MTCVKTQLKNNTDYATLVKTNHILKMQGQNSRQTQSCMCIKSIKATFKR